MNGCEPSIISVTTKATSVAFFHPTAPAHCKTVVSGCQIFRAKWPTHHRLMSSFNPPFRSLTRGSIRLAKPLVPLPPLPAIMDDKQ